MASSLLWSQGLEIPNGFYLGPGPDSLDVGDHWVPDSMFPVFPAYSTWC